MSIKNEDSKSPRRSQHKGKLEPISLDELDADRVYRTGGPGVLSNLKTPPPPVPHLEAAVAEYVRENHLEDAVRSLPHTDLFGGDRDSVSPGAAELLSPGGTFSSPGDVVEVNSVLIPQHNSTTAFHQLVSPGDGQSLSRGDSDMASPGDNIALVAAAVHGFHEHNDQLNGDEASLVPEDMEAVAAGDNVSAIAPRRIDPSPPGSIESVSPSTVAFATREQHLQIRPLTRAEDGHSANEQRTYQALWNSANPVVGQKFRLNTIGHAGLAKMLKVDKRQTKRWIPELINKLSIEIIKEPTCASKTTYRVYDRDEICARRIRAGYTSYIRNRGGVELLPAYRQDSSNNACRSPGDKYSLPPGDYDLETPASGDKERQVSGDNKAIMKSSPGRTMSPGGGDTETPEGGDTVSPPYKEVDSKLLFHSSSSLELVGFLRALRQMGVDADDEFGAQLIARSRKECPDATVEEILHFTKAKAQYRGIQRTLTGFLLTAVPSCLRGESFRLYREAERARIEEERTNWVRLRQSAEEALAAREGREPWDIENAQDTLKWLRDHQPWVFELDVE